ncbi:gluconate 2-dehydrogenase subunit 3 family protein [Nesterenkonia lutea]|uniref:Gluconate 2-dehydrogenase gamma chain n=1 Tax=Nesterenkonia lutea TaxID=272919 RepID=A0ABR9JBZ4_9MICC|nr:gluconate 2-dehydrogenase subunit 3 family protein [Nesterenkonia lutea]MBE1523445.1 gluconate 2-dehydrogenase gamma chain [Nesterenkonia lutea]
MLSASTVVGGLALIGCSSRAEHETPQESSLLDPDRGPLPPSGVENADEFVFFSEEESRTVQAMVARIIPGDDEDPGAVQAGVPIFIDRKLEMFEAFAEPTYREGPFAEGYEGDEPQTNRNTVPVAEEQLYRYGFQSELTPQEFYRAGLAGVDRLAQTRSGSLFADLDEDAQDALLMVLDAVQQRSEGGEGTSNVGGGSGGNGGSGENGGNAPSSAEMDQAETVFRDADPGAFFDTVRLDTIEGMFSDPVYGGNRGLVGWTMIGWPGAQRSYSPREMLYGTDKQPTSMEGLTPMNPDRAGGGRGAMEQPRNGVHSH